MVPVAPALATVDGWRRGSPSARGPPRDGLRHHRVVRAGADGGRFALVEVAAGVAAVPAVTYGVA